MPIGLALLVSADPVTIQQFSHALQELSVQPDVCREVPAAVGLLKRRRFDAVIVDLQMGEQSALVLDAARISPSNQTAVTFVISGSNAEGTAFRKRSAFVFRKAAFCKVNAQYAQACLWIDLERATALFPVSPLHPGGHRQASNAGSSLHQCRRQRRGDGPQYHRSA